MKRARRGRLRGTLRGRLREKLREKLLRYDYGVKRCGIFIGLLCFATNLHGGVDPDLLRQIEVLLEQRALEQHPQASVAVTLPPVDVRLKLSACPDVKITPRGQLTHGRIPIGLRCFAPSPWQIFITANVTVELPVVVVTRALQRGERLVAEDLAVQDRNLAQLRSHYLVDLPSALGKELRRPIRAGDVVHANQIQEPIAVKRGDRVTIVAERGSVTITAPGEALQNGVIGEQIRVKNRQSERIVHARIRRAGVVVGSSG